MTVQSYWVVKTLDLRQKQFDETVQIALLNTAKELAKLTRTNLPNENLISRIASNYYVVNINNQINPDDLEFYLRKEFEAVSLKENFEFGIYDCTSDEMVYGSFVSFRDDEKAYNFAEHQRDIFPKFDEYVYYFGVRFPNKGNFLLNTMLLTIIFSVILLVAIVYFVYSMYIILYQRQLSHMQRDFINNMTHEFKTPISTINIASDVLIKNESLNKDIRLTRYAQIIKDQNQRLNNQVENVLRIARLEKDDLSLKKVDVDINGMIEEMSDSIEMKVQERKGELILALNAVDSRVKADILHFTNIVYNLLDNAIKYTNDKPWIRICTENINENSLRFSIEDRGVGIRKDYISKVFKKFYRVPTGNVHDVKGFGLGLYYVKYVCDQHRWKVEVRSQEGLGTIINIDMPLIQ